MGPLPKRKTSKARRNDSRSHARVVLPNLVPCPRCHVHKLPHHVCPSCGTYNGREVFST